MEGIGAPEHVNRQQDHRTDVWNERQTTGEASGQRRDERDAGCHRLEHRLRAALVSGRRVDGQHRPPPESVRWHAGQGSGAPPRWRVHAGMASAAEVSVRSADREAVRAAPIVATMLARAVPMSVCSAPPVLAVSMKKRSICGLTSSSPMLLRRNTTSRSTCGH